jgi:hypothetical protein
MKHSSKDQFLATASRTSEALRPTNIEWRTPTTRWESMLATASRTSSALEPSRQANEQQAGEMALRIQRERREKLFYITTILSVVNLILMAVTATFMVETHNGLHDGVAKLFRDPKQLGTYAALAISFSTAIMATTVGFLANSVTRAAYSNPKLNDEGIRLKQPVFNQYVTEKLKSFDELTVRTSAPVIDRIYTNRKGIVYELRRKGQHILVIERNIENDVLSVGEGSVRGDKLRYELEIIDGSKGHAELKFTDKDEKQLEGTFKNETYGELRVGSLTFSHA